MRLICTGDFHILEKRIKEINQYIFSPISSKLQTNEVDGITILGDIFDYDRPNDKEISCFISFIQSIPINKTIYIISGNHDVDKTNNAISWVNQLRSGIIYSQNELDVCIDGKKVKMLHADVSESKVGPDDRMFNQHQSFKQIEADFILLGHIHKSQVINETPLVLHPGSPYFINFGERNDNKGYYIIDFASKNYKFILLDVLPMVQIDVKDEDISKLKDQIDKIDYSTKLKLFFDLQNPNLDTNNKIQEVIKICNKIQNDLSTIKEQTSNRSIPSLFEKFCKDEKVDKEIYELLKGMI